MVKLLFLVGLLFTGCTRTTEKATNPDLMPRLEALEAKVSHIGPPLVVIMTTIQQLHAKLWFSGEAQNWRLAQYEIDNIKGALETMNRYSSRYAQVKAPLEELNAKIMKPAIDKMSEAIQKKDHGLYERAYAGMTVSCNQCHQATGYDFIVMQTPLLRGFTNQQFRLNGKTP